nr:DUF2778 domain-containing protein [Massilia oculi]
MVGCVIVADARPAKGTRRLHQRFLRGDSYCCAEIERPLHDHARAGADHCRASVFRSANCLRCTFCKHILEGFTHTGVLVRTQWQTDELYNNEEPAISGIFGLGGPCQPPRVACHVDAGPIPLGAYYILDRQSGGLLGPLRDLFNDKSQWFALYAADGKVDDETFCNKVKRGSFRLHPKGRVGISQGCITLNKLADFNTLRAFLKGSSPLVVPGTSLKAYGRVTVK